VTVLVSYVPTEVGTVALSAGIRAATIAKTDLLVVNAASGTNFAEVTFADEKALDAVHERLAEAGVQHEIRQLVDVEDIAEAVLKLAEEVSADMIVVGLRRRSAVGKALLGSNAQHIILGAHCPVLSVRVDDR
jgi:nucleotide-binding universal stress UspA family protein